MTQFPGNPGGQNTSLVSPGSLKKNGGWQYMAIAKTSTDWGTPLQLRHDGRLTHIRTHDLMSLMDFA